VISPEVSRGEDAGVRSRDGRRALWRKRKRTGISIQAALIEQEGLAQILDVDPGLAPVDPRRQLRELRRVGVLPKGLALKDLRRWPAEPSPPARWDESRFAAALSGLCPVTVERASVEAYSRIMLRSAQLFGVDASLLAALSYQQSGCSAARRSAWGVGLTMLNAGLFPGDVARERRYPYGRLRAAQWEAVTLPLPQYPFLPEKLDEPSANLYFAAALLRVFEEQCPHIDAEFRSLPHRHPVSHFIWGDVVQDAGVEDRILTARRRFLAHYHAGALPPPTVSFRGLSLESPLDGAPRIAHHGLGETRDHGRRPHLGVDFISSFGEPVRAIADGIVRHAGTDTQDGRLLNLEPMKAALVPPREMGPRGLFVRIDHAASLHSVYAHLAQYTVQGGQRVRRGELIGYVGRTGIRDSDPHLHFGLFERDVVVDPLEALSGLVFGPAHLVQPPKGSVR
jgi:murein DD-endopeptidase MepM/ murein hydrolase activator NlpD